VAYYSTILYIKDARVISLYSILMCVTLEWKISRHFKQVHYYLKL